MAPHVAKIQLLRSARRVAAVVLLVVAGCSAESGGGGKRSDEVSIPVGDFDLRGTLVRPTDPPGAPVRHPAVLILPGSGPTNRDGASRSDPGLPPIYRSWANALADRGVVVLRYDKRFLSHPDLAAGWTLADQIEEAVAAYDYLRAHPAVDPDRVHLLGHGEGGDVAPLVAERTSESERPASLLLVNTPALAIDRIVLARLHAQEVPAGQRAAVRRAFERVRAGDFPADRQLLGASGTYWMEWIAASEAATRNVGALDIPVRIVQCELDEALPGPTREANLARWRELDAQRERIELRTHAGLGHLGTRPGGREAAPELILDLVTWFAPSRPAE